MEKKIYFFDDKVKEKMSLLDLKGKNIFHEKLDLLVDFSPYISQIVFGKTMKLHDFMLIYVAGGSSKIEYNMREFNLHKGSMIYLNKNSTIRTLEVTPDYRPLTLSFDLPETLNGTSLLKRDMASVDTLDEQQQQWAENCFLSMATFAPRDKHEPINSTVKGTIISLLGMIDQAVKDEAIKKSSSYNAAKILVDNFYYELNKQDPPDRTLGYYAKALGKSIDYVTRVVKKETGFPPMHWINLRTIRLAQAMLCDKQNNYSINYIAEYLNCGSLAYFSKLFKSYIGVSPTEYRAQYV